MKGTIVFLASHPQHARMWRRIYRLAARFESSRVLAFDRQAGTAPPLGTYDSLGLIRNGHYLERLRVLKSAFWTIRHSTDAALVVYCFSLDLLALAWLACLGRRPRPRLAYEIADIRNVLAGHGPGAVLLRFVERFLIRRSSVVVLTSGHFFDGYFREIQRFTAFRHVVIEHKPEVPADVRNRIAARRDAGKPLTIGYFGMMKSPASFSLLIRLARSGNGRLRVVMRGIFVPPLDASRCIAEIEATDFVRYEGPYRSPHDLERIYLDVDLIWDAYNETPNSRWQRTTRFSEALFFKRPVLFNPTTQDGELAARFDIGQAVQLDDPAYSIKRILSICDADLERWRTNLDRVPESLVLYQNEYDDLYRALSDNEVGLGDAQPSRPRRDEPARECP